MWFIEVLTHLKTLINGPKIKPQEQAAINDPKTNVLITDKERIKEVSLAHNVEILTKMKPLPQYEYITKGKQAGAELGQAQFSFKLATATHL